MMVFRTANPDRPLIGTRAQKGRVRRIQKGLEEIRKK